MEKRGFIGKVKSRITLTVSFLKALFQESRKRVSEERENINKINVFPVPDKDTGTNLLNTLSGIIKAIERKDYQSANHLISEMLEKKYLLKSGRGNVGIIISAWLVGFFQELGDNISLDADLLSRAMKRGESQAYRAIAEPKEGTILDVITASAGSMDSLSREQQDLIYLMTKTLEQARQALVATTQKMDVLKKNKVVDAGALGFVLVLESFLKVLLEAEKSEKEEDNEQT